METRKEANHKVQFVHLKSTFHCHFFIIVKSQPTAFGMMAARKKRQSASNSKLSAINTELNVLGTFVLRLTQKALEACIEQTISSMKGSGATHMT